MMTANLRPPSAGRSRSPSPQPLDSGRASNARASMGPSARPTGFAGAPLSPRPGGGRPTSELLGNNVNFQTPEAEAIDQWFENLQNYEATLEEMAAASLDVNFKEELSAIEQWFKVLSEAERTAALYSLLQHSTQVQIRFFITVLQQMARSDPMTALLSPAVGGSMQAQMEAKLAQMSLKSPGLKSNMPGSPVARSFSGSANRNSLAVETASPSFLSPESANNLAGSPSAHNDAAGVLAQQRAKLKANAAHRISAPALSTMGGGNVWNTPPLDQVSEQRAPSPTQELSMPSPASRPKSTDFSGLANALRSPRLNPDGDGPAALSPMIGDSWASMVNTPLIPMFQNTTTRNAGGNLDAAAAALNDWSGNNGNANSGRVPMLDDAKKFRRPSKGSEMDGGMQQGQGSNNGYQQQQQQQQQRNAANGGWRNGPNQGQGVPQLNMPQPGNGMGAWNGAKSPGAMSNVSMGRSDDSMAGLGVGGFNMGMGMGSPGLGMGGMPGMAGLAAAQMNGMNPFMMNMSAMGISPEAQLLAAQMAASGFVGQQGLSPYGLATLQAQQIAAGAMAGRGGMNVNTRMARGAGASKGGPSSAGVKKNDEEDVDPKVLEDIPAWLRSLRLHKYTPNFEKVNWRDMVMMDEAALEAHGVAALGARRKMLKTFEIVRKKMGLDGGEGAVSPAAEGASA